MPTLRKLARGHWEWDFYGPDGRRRRGRVRGTREDAERELEIKMSEAGRSDDVSTARTLFHRYERSPEAQSLARTQDHLKRIERFVAWWEDHAGAGRPLAKCRTADIGAYTEELVEKGLAPPTVLRHAASISSWLRWCAQAGIIPTNPALGAWRPKQPSAKRRGPDQDEVARFLDDLERVGGPVLPVYLLAYGIALRRGEIVRARWEDVAWSGASPESLTVRGTKTSGATATIPIASERLARWLSAHKKERGPIVANKDGQHYHPQSIGNLKRDAEGILGRPLPNLHLGRHAIATWMAQRGESDLAIAAVLRDSPRVVAERYAWLRPTDHGHRLRGFT
jgi:integrase